ncbi:MAG: nitrogen fixation protein NifQ [Campylobacterota bacterium]|nr:nitrogen fixation protein NifQ [Campylobacterota bacterium]
MSPRVENRLNMLELKVTNFLKQYAKDEYSKNEMAFHVAKISLMQNHLYEDLGFRNRFEMGGFMKKHFPELSKIKPKDKLWKKFIYDSIGEVAPACAKCEDQISCFSGNCN